MPEIQHINVKIFAQPATGVDLSGAIPVFHRWIQTQTRPELLLDVADYRHVPAGPGVLLIAHEANYSLDLRAHRLGLLYNRKAVFDGSLADRIRQAWESAVEAAALVQAEPEFAGKLQFDAGEAEIVVNDRMLAPNSDETWQTLEPAVREVLNGVFGADGYTLTREGEPRERFRVAVRAKSARPVSELLPANV